MMQSGSGVVRGSLPAGLRARLWIPLHCVFSSERRHGDCWLWMLRKDGRLEAVSLEARHLRDDTQMEAILQLLDANPGSDNFKSEHLGQILRLQDAPLLPALLDTIPRWHPVCCDMHVFADELNASVAFFLLNIGMHTSFRCSVANYNALCALSPEASQRRMRALWDFPALMLPLLLRQGDLDTLGFGLVKPAAVPTQVLDAIDRGDDPVEVLAEHYRISRKSVRSPLWGEFWAPDACLQELLWRLDAIPPHAWPRSRKSLETWLPSLMALPFTASGGKGMDYRVLGRMFSLGWEKTWRAAAVRPSRLPERLRQARDFLAAAFEVLDVRDVMKLGSADAFGLAWLACHGLHSLLNASGRWNGLPMTRRFDPDEPQYRNIQLQPLMGFHADAARAARELVTAKDFELEEKQMRQPVSNHWWKCLEKGNRIIHLRLLDGEHGTACFRCMGMSGLGPLFALESLKGFDGAKPSDAMSIWAQRIQNWINDKQNLLARQAVKQQARQCLGWGKQAERAALWRYLEQDLRSEMKQLLRWAHRNVRGRIWSQVLLQEHIAGTGYTNAEVIFIHMRPGDALALVREPHNPHDRHAIRIEWQGRKLGYVPRDFNTDLAQRLDRGEPVQARLTAKGNGAGPWVELEFCATLQES